MQARWREYENEVVEKFDKNLTNCKEIKHTINTFIDTKRRDDYNYQT